METSVAPPPSVRVAFSRLVDYAGLFPPAQLSMERALAEYDEARFGPYAWMLGRFIVPAALLEPASAAVEGPFSVIVDAGALDGVGSMYRRSVRITALEIPLRDPGPSGDLLAAVEGLRVSIDGAGLGDVQSFVESPRSDRLHGGLAETMQALSGARLEAKLRCGGVAADAFPSVEEVAAFIGAASRAGVAFKATAGLHHPVRHIDAATGFTMHGFLNILTAAALAARGDLEMLGHVVAEEDPAAFVFEESALCWRDERVELAQLAATRASGFVGYGSCSFAEPVEDLTALGILPAK